MKPLVEEHILDDLTLLDDAIEYVNSGLWYAVRDATPPEPLVSVINRNGTYPGRENTDELITVRSYTRQPYGWDDESTARRAPIIYELFQYINNTYFNNSFTLDGIGEEVGGSRRLWEDPAHQDLPDWGARPADTPVIWTAYANGSPITQRAKGRDSSFGSGAHRDWSGDVSVPDSTVDGYYTLLVILNKQWKTTDGAQIIFYETIDPGEGVQTHWRRGYGIGNPSHIFGHVPGQVLLYPATAIHQTLAPNRKKPSSGLPDVFAQKLAFRVRRKS